jgi:4-hydroxybenzoate polyprenyltransferase
MLLGALLAINITETALSDSLVDILRAFISICLVASGNYGINEVLDVEADGQHPQKKLRAIPSGKISSVPVVIISIILYVVGISIVLSSRNIMLAISVSLLLLSGVLYNVKPIRLKDKPYMDFIAESFNNPIRLMVGWYSVATPEKIVPSSFILGFWFLGMFLMASKRFGEYRFFKDKDQLVEYRKSFKHYTVYKIQR